MAVGRNNLLHMTTDGKASRFAGFQSAKGAGIEEFKSLIRGGIVEVEISTSLPPKTTRPRDKLRKNCTTAVLNAISEYQCIFCVPNTEMEVQ